jgi:hypothetical protein
VISTESIKKDFAYVKAWTGNSEVYQNSVVFQGHGDLFDLYFRSKNKDIKQEQVDRYSQFKSNYKGYIDELL